MRSFRFILVFLLAGCATPSVVFDYDKEVNFNQYKTYNYLPDIETGLSELDSRRLFTVLDSVMQTKGFSKAENSQLLINIFSKTFTTTDRNTVGVGVGGSGRNVGGGVTIGIPIGGKELNQEITFDFVDANKDELIWQAISQGRFKEKATPDQRINYFKSVVKEVLSGFPPDK
jgi:hypothetical protein